MSNVLVPREHHLANTESQNEVREDGDGTAQPHCGSSGAELVETVEVGGAQVKSICGAPCVTRLEDATFVLELHRGLSQ